MARKISEFKRMPGPRPEAHTDLDQWRIKRGFSYRYLASIVGVNKNSMFKYCHGMKIPLLARRVWKALYPDAPVNYDGKQKIYVRALKVAPGSHPRLYQVTKIEAMIQSQQRRFLKGKKRLARLSTRDDARPNKRILIRSKRVAART